jgi:hypothetical protein
MPGQVIAHERIKQTASLPTSSEDLIEEQGGPILRKAEAVR